MGGISDRCPGCHGEDGASDLIIVVLPVCPVPGHYTPGFSARTRGQPIIGFTGLTSDGVMMLSCDAAIHSVAVARLMAPTSPDRRRRSACSGPGAGLCE
ncbi:MAG TPA: hypothetical protein DIT18_07440 [Pseudomonas sp.]|nr:hypothetical protein [Pseudomonas sp.]